MLRGHRHRAQWGDRRLVLLAHSARAKLLQLLVLAGARPLLCLEPLIEGLPLVAHNKPFDEGCLKAVFRVYQMDYPDYEFYDTLAASRRAFRYLANHQLQTVAAECGYHLENHHHALADAEACAWIAREIL